MGPVKQNPIQRTVSLFICVCIALCTIVAHNIAQNRPDSFPPLPSRQSPHLYTWLPILCLTPPAEGFPSDELREIFTGCQWIAKVANAVEVLPKI